MTEKERYRNLCKTEKTIPIFSRDWWMDAVCGEDNWNVILVEDNGQIIASMPYYIKKKYGLRFITQPPLTQTNGLWIKYPDDQRSSKRHFYEKEIMNKIIDKLENLNVDLYSQNFHYSFTNWQPFYWRGFQQTTRYTFVIEDLSSLDTIFSQFSKVVRKNIRKTAKQANIYNSDNIEKFYTLNEQVFKRQGLKVPYSLDFLKRLDRACSQNKARQMFFGEDKERNIHSIVYIVWDETSAYLLMSGIDPKYRDSDFKTLLVWEAIQFASKVTKRFDFEGSMIENVADYFTKFGAIKKPYFQITKMSRRMQILSNGKQIVNSLIKK